MSLQVDLWSPGTVAQRKIAQIMPAAGWYAYCWVEEANEYSRLPLLGWALVSEGDQAKEGNKVIGLCAMGDQARSKVKVAAVFLADELVNFRYYGREKEIDNQCFINIPSIIVEALTKIRYPPPGLSQKKPDWTMTNIARIAQEILVTRDADEKITPKRIGVILSKELGMIRRVRHDRRGRISIAIEDEELASLMQRFGVKVPTWTKEAQ